MFETIFFYVLATVILVSAILVVTLKNTFHSALWFALSMVGVAGIYALVGANILFAVQILLYSGGVTVFILLAIFSSCKSDNWPKIPVNEQWLGALLIGGVLMWVLKELLSRIPSKEPVSSSAFAEMSLKKLFVAELVLPIEVIFLVLLVAAVGAILVFSARRVRW